MADEQVLAAVGQRDAALAAQQPTGVPQGWEDHVFKTPGLPDDAAFTLRNLRTLEDVGPFQPGEFVTDPATGITSAHDPATGEPFILRVRRQWTEHGALAFEHVEDDGEEFTMYTVNVIRDNLLEIEEPEFS